jgi:hypothetical protein
MIPAHDALANGQPDASSGIFVIRVEALEKAKYTLLVLGFDSDAVIADGENALAFLALSADIYFRPPFRATVFKSIPDQVLEYLVEMRVVHPDRRKRIGGYAGARLGDGVLQVIERGLKRFIRVRRIGGRLERCRARVGQKIAHQFLHP